MRYINRHLAFWHFDTASH